MLLIRPNARRLIPGIISVAFLAGEPFQTFFDPASSKPVQVMSLID
jgi:hypothetical protein